MAKVHIGIGSNLGNKASNIKKSIKLLETKSRLKKISPFYETEPVGYGNQEWFINCVVKIETDLAPFELLEFLKSIEKTLKRKKTVRFGPRTIDLDILFYDDKIINKKNLIIPHPRMHERLFVLQPLSDLSPKLTHPKLKKTTKELRNKIKNSKSVKLYIH